MAEKSLIHDGAQVFYTVSGQGAPVLLIHGFGEDGRVWEGIVKQLEKEFLFIVPDLPGSGKSAAAAAPVTMESLAESIKAIIESEKAERCAVIGHSMGGYVALALIEKYPLLAGRLGLFHSTSFADNEEKKAGRKKNIDFITRNGAEKFLETSIPKLFSPETNKNNPGLIQQTIQRYRNFSTSSLVHYTAAMMNRPERTEILKNFPGPVLFICGEYDTAVPLEQSLKECHLPGISYIYVCTHSGHSGMLEESEFCINAVRYFLSGK